MIASWVIISGVLVVANAILIFSEYQRRKYNKEELARLKNAKLAEGIPEGEIEEDDLKDEIEPQQRYSWIFGIVICLDIWLIGAVLTHLWAEQYFTDVEKADSRKALFGDSFGAVNALVSAFAFAGMIVAFILQRYELRLQRKELRDQRKEFQQQNQTLAFQRFESTFFHMLEVQQQIVADLYVKEEGKEWVEEDAQDPMMGRRQKQIHIDRLFQGRNFFRYTFLECVHHIKGTNKDAVEVYGLSSVMYERGFSQYDKYYTATYFDHYFRHFYRILKFIKQNDGLLTYEEQYQYASMLRATLSRYELVWLYYNGLSENGCTKLKPLMERYAMLKNLRVEFLTLCKENRQKLESLGLSNNEVVTAGFSCLDYEFYLTDRDDDVTKYSLSAFYNHEELPEGQAYYRRWKDFCVNHNISC